MNREEFERIKQAEKEHLRALKKLKETVRDLERRKAVSGSLSDLASKTGDLLDEHTALVEKLSQETAMQEARFEVAMESIDASELDAKHQELQDEADLARIERERQETRARDLVRQVKMEMGSPASEEKLKEARPDATPTNRAEDDTEPKGSAPEKTIGRMRRS